MRKRKREARGVHEGRRENRKGGSVLQEVEEEKERIKETELKEYQDVRKRRGEGKGVKKGRDNRERKGVGRSEELLGCEAKNGGQGTKGRERKEERKKEMRGWRRRRRNNKKE